MREMIHAPLRQGVRWLAILAGVLLLSACASTWSAKVTTFQNWPQDAITDRYTIQAAPEGRSELEYQAVADSLRIAMGAQGLVEGDKNSRLQVSFNYDSVLTRQWVEQYADPYFDGFHSRGYIFGGFGFGSNYGGGVFYSPQLISVPVDIYKNTLQVVIRDLNSGNREIYNVTAISESDNDNLIEIMPYLSKAAFANFPGDNGKTQHIKIKRNP